MPICSRTEVCRICGRPTEWDESMGAFVLCRECWDVYDPGRSAYRRAYYLVNKARENRRCADYYRNNRCHRLKKMKEWRYRNRLHWNEYMRDYMDKYRKEKSNDR